MARNKEAAVIVLDVGPHMSNYLPYLKRSMFLLAESKVLNHAAHELAYILFGTTGKHQLVLPSTQRSPADASSINFPETNNEVHTEIAEQGDPDQYKHISVVQHLACGDLQLLSKINSFSCGRGYSDHVSALCVALDLFKKAVKNRSQLGLPRVKRRVLLISTFDSEVEELDADFRNQLTEQLLGANQADKMLQGVNFSLEVYGVADGLPAKSPEAQANRDKNLAGLQDLLAQVSGSYKELPGPVDMSALFVMKETTPTGGKVSLTIGSTVNIEVQVYKKAAKTPLPSLSMYHPPAAVGGTGKVSRDTEYRHPADPDHALAPQEKVKAYRYGKQYVPITDAATEEELLFKVPKSLEVVGFTDRANIERWQYTSECSVVLPQTEADAVALSALVRALAKTDRVAVLRMCISKESSMAVGTPFPAPPGALQQQDCLVVNHLPYKEDIRHLSFRSFHNVDDSKQHLKPNAEQRVLMRKLVKNLRLKPTAVQLTSQATQLQAPGSNDTPTREQLVPEETLNPMIQRFYWYVGQKALDPHFQVPDPSDDLLAAAVLDQQPLDSVPTAIREIMEALPKAFPITAPRQAAADAGATEGAVAEDSAPATAGGGEGAAAATAPVLAADEAGVRLVSDVGTATPVEDFETLLSSGQVEKAFSGLQAAITTLMDTSVGTRLFAKATEALKALRAAAVAQQQATRFNEYLDRLRLSYQLDMVKQLWWRSLMQQGIGPVHDQEVSGAGMSRAAAEQYVRVHGADEVDPAAPPKPVPTEVDDEDEFEGME